MSDAFVQLLDMGIPVGRAKAALRRTKGDVMSAAERVFAGEFDDIPSDDEGEDEAGPSKTVTGLQTPDETPDLSNATRTRDVYDEDVSMSDDDGSEGGFVEDFQDDDDEMTENRLLSDPYAGIFFSKDRVEVVNQPLEPDEFAVITLPNGLEKMRVRLLGRGEWMSGCPEGNEQSFLFQLHTLLGEGAMLCSSRCGHRFKRRKEDFFAILPSFSQYTAYVGSRIQQNCPKCRQVTCLACGEKASRSSTANATTTTSSASAKGKGKAVSKDNLSSLLHCPNIQGVLLGVGLYMIEQTFKHGQNADSSGSPNKSPPNKKRKAIAQKFLKMSQNFSNTATESPAYEQEGECDDDSDLGDYGEGIGVGLGSRAVSKGTGYAGNAREDRSGQRKAEELQDVADRALQDLLTQVRVYLPFLNREGGAQSSDHFVHPTALAHLRRRSAFVNNLLRNDSLLDMSKRGNLYRALFDWLEIVSSHEALASMLAMPQMRPVKTEPAPNGDESVIVTYEGSSSPRELLENGVIQAQAALKGLSRAQVKDENMDGLAAEEVLRLSRAETERKEKEKEEEDKNDANAQLREFCNRIITSAQTIDKSLIETKGRPFVNRMRESLPRLPDAGVKVEEQISKGESTETVLKIYEDWAGRARFQYCDMTEPRSGNGSIAYRHAFSPMITGLDGMDMPKRSLAIAKELAILTTSLPVAWHSTIFLRVDEARVDCLKAMIIGPEGTPYENGCFIFDIFLPLDYNMKCPHVKSMTTNGGKYRYNPNLYADGKVCLSLLGTWSGPGWISGQSTLLQVLISIQSLILCEEPYLNEPGWAGQGGSAQSKMYSANVKRMVLVDAMANNIKNPPYPFENEIKTHVRLKAKSILEQIEKWKNLDDGRPIAGDSFGGPPSPSPTSTAVTGNTKGTAFDKAAEELKKLLYELDPDTKLRPENKTEIGTIKEKETSKVKTKGKKVGKK